MGWLIPKASAGQRAAEKQRPRIPHKHLGRMEIPQQEARDGARHGGGREALPDILSADGEEKQAGNQADAAAQPVDSVGEVDGVERGHHHKHGKRDKPDAEIHQADEGDIHCRAPRHINGNRIACAHQQLREELLDTGQTQIALFDHLDVIVEKPDAAAAQRQQHTRHQFSFGCIAPGIGEQLDRQKKLADQNGRHQSGGRSQHENQPAHRRGALLALMPGRTIVPDGLAELQAMEHRDEDFPSKADRKNETSAVPVSRIRVVVSMMNTHSFQKPDRAPVLARVSPPAAQGRILILFFSGQGLSHDFPLIQMDDAVV